MSRRNRNHLGMHGASMDGSNGNGVATLVGGSDEFYHSREEKKKGLIENSKNIDDVFNTAVQVISADYHTIGKMEAEVTNLFGEVKGARKVWYSFRRFCGRNPERDFVEKKIYKLMELRDKIEDNLSVQYDCLRKSDDAKPGKPFEDKGLEAIVHFYQEKASKLSFCLDDWQNYEASIEREITGLNNKVDKYRELRKQESNNEKYSISQKEAMAARIELRRDLLETKGYIDDTARQLHKVDRCIEDAMVAEKAIGMGIMVQEKALARVQSYIGTINRWLGANQSSNIVYDQIKDNSSLLEQVDEATEYMENQHSQNMGVLLNDLSKIKRGNQTELIFDEFQKKKEGQLEQIKRKYR